MKRQIKKIISVLLTVCFVLSITAAAVSALEENPNNNVVPVDSVYLGNTYEQWSEKWWQWAVSIPADQNPILAPSGSYDASIGQSGDVWFLAGTSNEKGIERTVTIPAGKSIFFPIVNILFYNDDDYSEDFMRDVTTAIIDDTKLKQVKVDGTPLKNLDNFRVGSNLFTVETPENFVFDPTLLPGSYSAVSDGYWIMLKPLSKGVHTIYIHGKVVNNHEYIGINEVGVKYTITVT